ncbi:hypothetical protein BDW59DRAFT_159317 [Aspergillus cavernicola]|uniref:Uncharacterized protein n=1 Tax=Aspergillus cavernicola TaxID=176166 RepID=A0ABR4IQ13_9EURO
MPVPERQGNRRQLPRDDTLFLGESSSLTYVVHAVLALFLSATPDYQKQLHFPIAEGLDPSRMGLQDIVQAQVQRNSPLATFGGFTQPFPVLEKAGFLQKCGDNRLSLLVLNSVLMIAVTIYDGVDIALLEMSSLNRHQGRELFYRQARALYESDSDPDKINNVMAVFLMSFLWGGPNNQKDPAGYCNWLGSELRDVSLVGLVFVNGLYTL